MLVITQTPGNIQDLNFSTGESWRYVPKAQIAALNPENPESLKILTDEFYSACYPEISYDGKYMLFAAQKNEGDLWQIWEMDLRNRKSRKIISLNENCIDPAYLPGRRMVFSKLTRNDTVKEAHCLFTCNLDGSALRQITFNPHASFATAVLKDGRLLTISRQLLPDHGEPMLMVSRPDGTKSDMFYKGNEATAFINRARETSEGKIIFIEADINNALSGNVVLINYNRPLHTRVNLTADISGSFYSVLPVQSDKFIVSYRKSDTEHFALYEFNPEKQSLGRTIYHNPDYDIIDVVEAGKYDRPRKLPSEVDLKVKTGLLLCQDINFKGFQSASNNPGTPKAHIIEVLGIDSTYGVVNVAEDGSFYLKILADLPFQIQILDEDSSVLDGPCSWLWLRPNERRGCVGCHENPELVPVNRIPLAVRRDPEIIPTSITKIKEKIIELE